MDMISFAYRLTNRQPMEKPGSDEWKKFSWKKLKEQAKDLGGAAGREISALLKGEKSYKTETMDQYKARRAQEDEEAKNALYKKHGIPQKFVPPPRSSPAAERPSAVSPDEMNQFLYGDRADNINVPRLVSESEPPRRPTLEQQKASHRLNVALGAQNSGKTAEDRRRTQMEIAKAEDARRAAQ